MRRSRIATLTWIGLSLLLLIGISVQTFRVRQQDFDYYYKEKFARRGEIRKAKEKKKTLSFSQQRSRVLRSLWFDEKEGERRQFHLQASLALFDLRLTPNGPFPQETFLRPHGWLQEKIGWELIPSEEEVEQKNGIWKRVKTKRRLAEKEQENIRPFQLFRYYDATKAVWDIQKNIVTLFQVHFTDFKKQDHGSVFDFLQARVLMKGYAEEMTFHFKESEKEEISSKGFKIHFDTDE